MSARNIGLALMLTFASLGVGCGPTSGATGGTTPNGGGGGAQASTGFTIQNGSSQSICYAYVSPTNDSMWGPDRLGQDVIGAGETYQWGIDAGAWDVKLEDCDHTTLYEQRNLQVVAGQMNVLSVQ